MLMSRLILKRGIFVVNNNSKNVTKNASFWSAYKEKWLKYPLPIWAGLTVVTFLQYRRIRKRHDESISEAVASGTLEAVKVTPDLKVRLYSALPLEAASRIVGKLSKWELPEWSRPVILGMYARKFGANMEEALISDLKEYKTVAQFFKRRLKPGSRTVDPKVLLTCPCDGTVLMCGPVKDGHIEQVKGLDYSLKDFLGDYQESQGDLKGKYVAKKGSRLYQITIYLAPGDYHCFHSPADWTLQLRRHYSGKLLSVRPSVATWMPKLFTSNERVVYLGQWNDNKAFFAFAAVGATSVGSIVIGIDQDLTTNCKGKQPQKCCELEGFPNNGVCSKGDYFGEFNLGSTIVLVFEAPEKFDFSVRAGDKGCQLASLESVLRYVEPQIALHAARKQPQPSH